MPFTFEVPSTSSARRAALSAVANALQRNADYLAKCPDVIWQQLYNQLQWDPEPVAQLLAPELQRRTAPDCTPWLWLHTPTAESSALVRTLIRSGGSPLSAFAVHAARRMVVVCDTSQDVGVWDVIDGRSLAAFHLPYHVYQVQACTLNSDGMKMVVVTMSGEALVCDTRTGQGIHLLQARPTERDPLFACAYSPDDKLIATAGISGVQIWDAVTGQRRDDLAVPVSSRCEGLAFSPDSTCLLATDERRLSLWRLGSLAPQWTVETTKYAGAFRCCAFSPDGKYVVAGLWDMAKRADARLSIQRHALRLLETANGQEISPLEEISGTISACAFSPNGKLLATCADEPFLTLWDMDTRSRIATLEGHDENLFGCAFSTAGDFVLSASSDSFRIWSVDKARTLSERAVQTPAGKTLSVAWDAHGVLALSSHGNSGTEFSDGVAKVWGPPNISERTAFAQPFVLAYAHNCAFHPDGSRIALINAANALGVRDARTGAMLGESKGQNVQVSNCEWSPDGQLLAATGAADVHFWNTDTLALRMTLKASPDHRINAFAFSPDGAYLVVASDYETRLWTISGTSDSVSFEREHRYDDIRECMFLPDGRTVATASGNSICLWDVATRRQHLDDFRCMNDNFARPAWAISPDGVYIAASGRAVQTTDGLQPPMSVWETRTGRHVVDFFGHKHFASAMAFSPDGTFLLSGGKDRQVKLWGLTSGVELMSLPLPDTPLSLAFHPWRPELLVGGSEGNVYHIELVGVTYGPLIVTAVDRGSGPILRCPVCGHLATLDSSQIGTTVDCVQRPCDGRMYINPFVTKMPLHTP